MQVFEIGHTLSDEEMNVQLQQGLGEFSFPKTLFVENLMPFAVVDATNGVIELESNLKTDGKTSGEFSFPTFGHLTRFVDNMLTITKLNGFERGIVLKTIEEEPLSDENNGKTIEEDPTSDENNGGKEAKQRGRKPKEQDNSGTPSSADEGGE